MSSASQRKAPKCHLDLGGAPGRAERARLFDRLLAEKNFATEARLRSQARLRGRLAAERRLAIEDDGTTAQGANGDSAPESQRG